MLKNDGNTVVEELIVSVREFIRDRDWEKFHKPKNLAESICIEAAELLQLFQWTGLEETARFKTDPDRVARIKEELADVIIYCLSMANAMKIDVTHSVVKKLESNMKKYPVSQYKGKAPCARRKLT